MIAKTVNCILLLILTLPVTAAQHSSEAILSSAPTQIYRSVNQPNRVTASMVAKQMCEQARGNRSGYCEIVSMDGEDIGRAVDLKSRAIAHPLFLWRFNRGPATVYLAGTVHVLKEGFFPLPRQYEQAFEASDKLVVEAAVEKIKPEQLQQIMLKYALLSQGTLRDLLPPKTHALLVKHAQIYGLPMEQLQAFKPALASQQLAVAAISAMGYDPSFGIEAHFSARTDPRDIMELETVEGQFKLLFDQPLDIQTSLLRETLEQFDSIAAQTDAMLAAWAEGDDRTIAALIREQTGDSGAAKEFLYQLLDQRNSRMAERIADMLGSSGSYFVLVGSAHLAGTQSIITELGKLGFYGQRILASDSTIDGQPST